MPQSFSYEWAWAASAVGECGMRRRTPAEMAAAFSNRRLVFLGDSHVLYMHNWLATALGGGCCCCLRVLAWRCGCAPCLAWAVP